MRCLPAAGALGVGQCTMPTVDASTTDSPDGPAAALPADRAGAAHCRTPRKPMCYTGRPRSRCRFRLSLAPDGEWSTTTCGHGCRRGRSTTASCAHPAICRATHRGCLAAAGLGWRDGARGLLDDGQVWFALMREQQGAVRIMPGAQQVFGRGHRLRCIETVAAGFRLPHRWDSDADGLWDAEELALGGDRSRWIPMVMASAITRSAKPAPTHRGESLAAWCWPCNRWIQPRGAGHWF